MLPFTQCFQLRVLCLLFLPLVILLGLPMITQAATSTASNPMAGSSLTITRPLYFGLRGSDVSALQRFLQYLEYFKYPTITGYFGTVTQEAVQAFQRATGIISGGTPQTTGYGRVGPQTLIALNALDTIHAPATTSTHLSFTRDLAYGMKGEDVRELQRFLNTYGFPVATAGPGSSRNETTFFGKATQSALIKFQISNGILPALGSVEQSTRTKLISRSHQLVSTTPAPSSGTPIKYANHPAVYLIENGVKRLFINAKSFFAWGFNWNQVQTIDDSISYPDGESITAPATTSPQAPEALRVSASIFQVDLSWAPVANATLYNVKRRMYNSDYATIASTAIASYTDKGISRGNYYYYVITAVNVDGESTSSSEAIAWVSSGGGGISSSPSDVTAPFLSNSAPSGTLALNTASTTISLTTDDSSICKYSTSPGQAFIAMTVFAATGGRTHVHTINDLANGSSYNYYVKCRDTVGNINSDDYVISFSIAADVSAPQVTLITPVNGTTVSGASITISADATDDVSVAGVQFNLDAVTNIGAEDVSSPYGVTWDSTSVADGGHTIAAVARDTSGNLATSTTVNVTVDNTAPVISSVATSSITTTSLLITWTTNEQSDSIVDYGTDSSYGSATSSSSTTTLHSLTLTGLSTTTAYHFRIKSVDAQGNIATSSDQTLPVLAYYVDSVNGNDANTGFSAVQAVQTISRVTTLDATAPLSTWNLANGSVWREELTVPRNNMTIEAYGTGTKPLLDASDSIATGSWSKTGGYTNIYQATLPVEVNPSGLPANWPSVWENGTRLQKVADLASLDATNTTAVGAYYAAANPQTATVVHYVKAKGAGNPASNGNTYEYAARGAGYTSWAVTGAVVRGIAARRNYQSYGSISLGRSAKAYDVQASEGNAHNLFLRGNAEVHGCTADEGYAYGSQAIPVVWYESVAAGESILIDSCLSKMSIANPGGFVGYLGHSGGTWGTVTITNSTAQVPTGQGGVAFEAENGSSIQITNGTAINVNTAIKTGVNTIVRGLSMTGASSGGALATFNAAGITYDIDSASVAVAAGVNLIAVVQSTLVNNTLILTHFTMTADALRGSIYTIRTTQTGNSVTSTNNQFQPNNGGGGYILHSSTVLTSDYNTWSTDGTFNVGGVSYGTLQLYKTGTSQDTHSTP